MALEALTGLPSFKSYYRDENESYAEESPNFKQQANLAIPPYPNVSFLYLFQELRPNGQHAVSLTLGHRFMPIFLDFSLLGLWKSSSAGV